MLGITNNSRLVTYLITRILIVSVVINQTVAAFMSHAWYNKQFKVSYILITRVRIVSVAIIQTIQLSMLGISITNNSRLVTYLVTRVLIVSVVIIQTVADFMSHAWYSKQFKVSYLFNRQGYHCKCCNHSNSS